jgi:hypothetical protein
MQWLDSQRSSLRHFFARSGTMAGSQSGKYFEPAGAIEVSRVVTEACRRHGCECVVGGSLSMMLVMPPRMTGDVDLNLRRLDGTSITAEDLRIIAADVPASGLPTFSGPTSIHKYPHLIMTLGRFTVGDTPVDVFSNTDWPLLSERLFGSAVEEDGLKFAPIEVALVFKVLGYDFSDLWTSKHLADITQVLDSRYVVDCEWVSAALESIDRTGKKSSLWCEILCQLRKP